MPINTSALVLKSEPDAGLACHASTFEIASATNRARAGVLSHYAAKALSSAHTLADWLRGIEALARGDVDAGRLAETKMPALQIAGDDQWTAPIGSAAGSRVKAL